MYTTETNTNTVTTPTRNPNIILALIGGIIGGTLGALLWGAVTAAMSARYVYLALAIGAFVAGGMILLGRSRGFLYGLIGGVLTLIALVAGNILSVIFAYARESGDPIDEVVNLFVSSPELTRLALEDTMTPLNIIMSIVSVLLAVYLAWSGKMGRQ